MPTARTIPLSVAERKHRLAHGAQREIAAQCGVSEAYVSYVVGGLRQPRTAQGRKTVRRVQVAVARKLRMRLDDVFAEAERSDAEALLA
jgi:predicted transcriptional regulator